MKEINDQPYDFKSPNIKILFAENIFLKEQHGRIEKKTGEKIIMRSEFI